MKELCVQYLQKISSLANSIIKRKRGEKPALEGIVGVHATSNGIAMAHVNATSLQAIEVCSYRYVPEKDAELQQEALQSYVEEHNLANCPCNYVLPVDKYALNMIEPPDVAPEEITEAVRWLIKDFIDYPIEEAVVDIFPLPLKMSIGDKDVSYVVVMHAAIIPDIQAMINGAGLKLKYIDIHELCLRNLAMLHPANEQGSLFIQFHPHGGYAVLTKKDTIFIARRMDLHLEKLLEDNVDVAEDFLESIRMGIQRSIDYCSSLFRQSTANNIILAPTELKVQKVYAFLNEYLGIPVYEMDLTGMMQFKQDISGAEQAQCLLAIAAGLRELVTVEDNDTAS